MTPVFGDGYGDADEDLVRFAPSSTDVVISAWLSRYVVADSDTRARSSAELASIDHFDLSLFSRRRALSATRSLSVAAALEALDAQLLSTALREGLASDEMKLALFVLRSVGGDFASIETRFDPYGDRASEGLALGLDAIDRVEDLSEIGFVAVTTSHGAGLLALPHAPDRHRTSTFGLYFVPILHEDQPGYEPRGNLAGLAATLADDLDAAGWHSRPMSVTGLASTWFQPESALGFIPATACLTFSVGTSASEVDPVNLWIADLEEPDDLADLLASANDVEVSGGTTRAIGQRGRIILVAETPSFDDGEVETVDLDAIVEVANTILANPSFW